MIDPHHKGMTLVEVLAVVVILGLIAGAFAVGVTGAFGKGKHELAKAGAGQIASKIELYRMEHDAWPDMSQGLAVLSDGYATPSDAYYVSEDKLLDPWGNQFALLVPGPNGHPFEIVSYGADAQPGGSGEDADISSVNLRK